MLQLLPSAASFPRPCKLLLALSLVVANCKTAPSRSEAADDSLDASDALSEDEVATGYSLILQHDSVAPTLDTIRAMTFSAYYEALVAGTSKSSSTPEAKDAFLRLHSNFQTVGAYWTAIGFEPTKVTPADVHQAIAMTHEAQTHSGGFSPDAYTSQPTSGFGLVAGGASFDPKECGALMAKLAVSVLDSSKSKIACTVACQSFWSSLNRCKEIIEAGKIALDEMMQSEVVKKKIPYLAKHPRLIHTGLTLAPYAVAIAPTMEKLLGFTSWVYSSDKAMIPGAKPPVTDHTPAEDGATRDSRDAAGGDPTTDGRPTPQPSVDPEAVDRAWHGGK